MAAMLKFIGTIFDRILFTVSFIFGVQAPEFMQQYIQRLSGHLDEAKYQLQQFQSIADLQFNGDLMVMIERYQTNADTAIIQTGNVIGAMVERVSIFESQLNQLQTSNYTNQLYYFIQQIDIPMAKATLNNFQLAVPLTIGALSTGVIFAFIMLIFQSILMTTTKVTYNKLTGKSSRKIIYPSKIKQQADKKKGSKIEPVDF